MTDEVQSQRELQRRRFRLRYRRDPRWRRLALAETVESVGAGLRVLCARVEHGVGDLQPLRIVYFSDLHWYGMRSARRAEHLIAAVNGRSPDFVFFGGDAARYLTDLPAAMDVLSRLEACQGKLAVLGNRESAHRWRACEAWHETFQQAGFTLLINEAYTPPTHPALTVVGLDDVRHGCPERGLTLVSPPGDARAGRPGLVITLSHSPDAVAECDADVGDLVLAGHTHGGQFRLPLFGPLYTSSIYGRQFDRGWFERQGGARMLVSAGVGESGGALFRFRAFCPRQVHSLDVVPRPAAAP